MLHPKIDKRNKQDLINQMKEMVPFYTPEWRFNPSEPDLGTALFLIFAEMFNENINRFNRVPLKNLIAFLNLFDVSLKVPQPATTYTTFYLSTGAKKAVLVPKESKLSATIGEDEIIFETEKNLLVTPSVITDAYKVSPTFDAIVKVDEALFKNEKAIHEQLVTSCEMFNVFDGENLQEHSLYLSHENMMNLSSTVKIELLLTHPLKRYRENEMAQILADQDYVEWLYYHQGAWQRFDFVEYVDNKVILHKKKKALIDETVVYSTLGKWIKCKVRGIHSGERSEAYAQIELGEIHVKTDYDDIDGEGGCLPDLLFNDDLHIHLEGQEGFYPFGEYFSLYSTFYLSSEEAFCKKGSQISLHLTLAANAFEKKYAVEQQIDWKLIMKESQLKKAEPQNISIMKVAWEYWDGQTWVILPMEKEFQEIFYNLSEESIDLSITFLCPLDMEETFVNSHRNYWIRARVLSIDNIFSPEVIYRSPWIKQIRISYKSESNYQLIQQCVTHNHLQYENMLNAVKTNGMVFQPFSMIDSSSPAFYLGFDRPPSNGPISIFFNFHDFNSAELEKPFIEWQYLQRSGRKSEWAPLKVMDDTQSLTRSGECRFSGPNDFAEETLFSKRRYWIRLIMHNMALRNRQIKSPSLKGIHLNTTKVIQQEAIHNENPVVITDHLDKTYQLMNFPILEEEVWVDESNHISEEQVSLFFNKTRDRISILRDSEQQIQRCWIKWERVEHFLDSKENDRHYVINRSEGKIMFGDGKNGKKPPNPESDYILVHYKIGGGTKGNIHRYEIASLESAIPFIQSVANHEPAGGGSNVEKLEDALKRGPMIIKHRNRAVTAEDFEALVREISQNVSKVKCLANYNAQIEKDVGCITIVILPESGVEGLQFFPELKARIENHLIKCSANTVAFPEKIKVIKPAFLEISLNVTLVVENIEMIVETELEALQRINQFLHPLTGNETGTGWEIGQQIHISVFYSFLKSIRHVRFIDKLYMSVYKIEHGVRTELNMTETTHIPHGIVINGKHQVHVKIL